MHHPCRSLRRLAALVPLGVLAASASAQTLDQGLRARAYPVDLPASLVCTDVTGDGVPDVLTMNSSNNTVNVLRGDGSGALSLPSTFPLGAAPFALFAAEVDGDGIVDLLSVNTLSKTLSYLRGLGSGNFAAAILIGLPESPNSLVVRDFSGDQIPDLAVAMDQNVAVLLGLGGGSFGAPKSFPVGASPQDLDVADFDGDQDLDLVLLCLSTSEIQVLRGDGSGDFGAPISTPIGGTNSRKLVVMDHDHDGLADLTVANQGSKNLTIALGNGDGTFTTQLHALADVPFDVLSADFDGDGHEDVACTRQQSGIEVLFGDGTGGLSTSQFLALVPNGSSFATADLDGDGTQDLVYGLQYRDLVVTLTQAGDGRFVGLQRNEISAGSARGLAQGDFTRDGRIDLVTTHSVDGSILVLPGLADGGFGLPISYAGQFDLVEIEVADLNRDGRSDLVCLRPTRDAVVVFLQTTTGLSSPISTTVGTDPRRAVLADFDGDKYPDLVSANAGSRDLTVMIGQRDGTFDSPTTINLASAPSWVEVLDVDGDGELDIVATLEATHEIVTFLGFGDGSFQFPLTTRLSLTPKRVRAADVDHDGDPDLAVVGTSSNSLVLLTGNGDGDFHVEETIALPGTPVDLDAADVDGDGQLDYLVTFTGGESPTLVRRTGNGAREFWPLPASVDQNQGRLFDFDADGAPDLAFSPTFDGSVQTLPNHRLRAWSGLAKNLAPAHGTAPSLVGSGDLEVGSPFSLRLADARPNTWFFTVLGYNAWNVPYKGGTLVPAFGLFLTNHTDALGRHELTTQWPGGLQSGLTIYYQSWIADPLGPRGMTASNAVRSIVP